MGIVIKKDSTETIYKQAISVHRTEAEAASKRTTVQNLFKKDYSVLVDTITSKFLVVETKAFFDCLKGVKK